MVQAYVKPATDEKKTSYVEWLPQFGADHVGPANALLSYCWGYKYTDVIIALENWCKEEGRNPKRTYVWICALCVNQHDASAEVKTADFFKREFGERVKAIGTILPLMLPWDEPLYLTRAWCLFELYTAISFEGACTITAIFTPEQEALFKEAVSSGGYAKIDLALDKIRSERATATIKADEDAIKQTIEETLLGGYQVRSQAQSHDHLYPTLFLHATSLHTFGVIQANQPYSRVQPTPQPGSRQSGASPSSQLLPGLRCHQDRRPCQALGSKNGRKDVCDVSVELGVSDDYSFISN